MSGRGDMVNSQSKDVVNSQGCARAQDTCQVALDFLSFFQSRRATPRAARFDRIGVRRAPQLRIAWSCFFETHVSRL